MRKAIFVMFSVLQMSIMSAQELTVIYKAVYNTASPQLFAEAGLSEEMRASLASAYKDVVMTYQLCIRGTESEFRLVPGKGKQEISFMGQTIDVNAAAYAQAQNYTYKNHAEGVILDKTEAFGKKVIVIDSIRSERFTVVHNEKKDILGFECLKANSADKKTTVWFSPYIPVKNEPIASGLDGLILQFDNGQQVFTAIDIVDTVNIKIARPEGEKLVSREEFSKSVKRRIDMMKRR